MLHDTKQLARVIQQIETAFAEVRHPGDDKMLHPACMDDMDIAAFYGSASWQGIPAAAIERENADLCGASAEAFQFLLPAYMIWALKNVECGSGSLEHTVWSLDPESSGADLRDFQLSKFASITTDQGTAIIAFLEALLDDEFLGHDAAKALQNHWNADR